MKQIHYKIKDMNVKKIKKYNPKHEEKIKVIDEALELAESQSRLVSLAASEIIQK